MPLEDSGVLRCLRCKGTNLGRSGKEVYRRECLDCGQHYFLVMQLQPVDPIDTPLLETASAKSDQGTG